MRSRTLLLGMLASVAACPPPEPPRPIPPVSTGKVRVRVFTEPSPVRVLAAAERFVFVATEQDLERFDDGGGVFALTAQTGLSGSSVVALGPDSDRKSVWVLTDGGLGRYDVTSEVYSTITDPPASIGLDFASLAKEGATVASASDGGAWIGTSKGLIYVSAKGGWSSTPIKDPIKAVARDRSGWLWIATPTGLLARKPSGDTVRIGTAQGCTITTPRLLVELPGDRMMVIGGDADGRERLAFGAQQQFVTYRALPDVTWEAATRRANGAVVMGGGRVYRIGEPDPTRVRPLARDGMRLVAINGDGKQSPWEIDPLDLVVPPGATSLGASADQLLIGTRDLGTARYQIAGDGTARPRDWLRRKQMFQDATTLSVACSKVDDCWIATGARQAWHWTGDRFVAGGPDQVVLAVVREPGGPIYALHRAGAESALHLSRIEKGQWTPVGNVTLTAPGAAPEVSFARFPAGGQLWIGLRYRDGMEMRAGGLAIIEPATGKVTYHRPETSGDKLPIPVGVLDADVRGDVAWFATNEGVARVANGQVRLWTENDGLLSELARAVTIAANGGVIVATGAGAAIWDGKTWTFPPALRFELNDVVATRNGQVWMATERGIAAWDGTKVRRVDMRRGLAENQILDVASDQFDRVWARGPGSLTLISQ
ncbi:MAG: hypothetical protein JNL83_01555 [Myxococcales bacterium]|nr:hypothetical protein [Myxococcales bacterium]